MSMVKIMYPVSFLCRQSCSISSKWPQNGQYTRCIALNKSTKFSTLRIRQTGTSLSVRNLSTSSRRKSDLQQKDPQYNSNQHTNTDLQAGENLKSWSWIFNVEFCGKICFRRTPFNVIVKPASPLLYPSADKAFVSLNIKSDAKLDVGLIEDVANNIKVNVNYTEGQLLVDGHFEESQMEPIAKLKDKLRDLGVSLIWNAEVPISFDADIQTVNNGSVMLEKLENQTCMVQTENGNCLINKVKSGDIRVISSTGDIISNNLLQGNATISTGGHGSISTGRLQGQSFNLSTTAGTISCKDIYAVMASLKTISGNVQVDNVHAGCDITTSDGSVNVGSVEGSIKAATDTGNITAYLIRHKNADLSTNTGDISLQVPSDVKTKYHLEALSAKVAPELNTEASSPDSKETNGESIVTGEWNSGGDNYLKADAKQGHITVAVQSWFDSLKLNK